MPIEIIALSAIVGGLLIAFSALSLAVRSHKEAGVRRRLLRMGE